MNNPVFPSSSLAITMQKASVKNSHKHNYIWYLMATDGGQVATTTCFGHHGGHSQVVHTKVNKLIHYANTV